MKKIILLILLLIPFIHFAQTRMGLTTTFNQVFRNLTTAPNSGVQWIVDMREEMEKPILSFKTGFVIAHRFHFGLELESGLEFQRYGYQNDGFTAIDAQGNQFGMISSKELYDYFSIPVRVGYSGKLGNRFRIGAIMGLNLNTFFMRTYTYDITYNDGTEERGSSNYFNGTGYSRFLNMANAGIQVEYAINRSFTVRLEPVGHYAITPVANAPIKERPYSFGLSAEILYTLGSREASE
jgi:hypothetical protein